MRILGILLVAGLFASPEMAWALANPASVFCVKSGGKSEIRKGSRGQYGVCRLPRWPGRRGMGVLSRNEAKGRQPALKRALGELCGDLYLQTLTLPRIDEGVVTGRNPGTDHSSEALAELVQGFFVMQEERGAHDLFP